MNLPTSEKNYRFQISAAEILPSLEINTSWYPERDMKFGIFRKEEYQLKYVKKNKYAHTR